MVTPNEPSSPLETVAWHVVLLAVASAFIALSMSTSPPGHGGDMWDSDAFLPLLVVLSLLAAVAGYRVPGAWACFPLAAAAMAPYYVTQVYLGRSADSGLWLVGLFLLVPLTAGPLVGALLGNAVRQRRSPVQEHSPRGS